MTHPVDRRAMLKVLGVGLSLPALDPRTSAEALTFARRAHARIEATAADVEKPPLRAFDEHQDATFTQISELILPETDTPGARAAGVNEFADLMLSEWFPERGRERYLKGLAKLDRRCRKRHGTTFVDCSEDQQVAMLEELEREAERKRKGRGIGVGDGSKLAKVHFFDLCKWLTLVGYYTSEVGMREELGHRTIPGRYEPCLEI